MTTSKIVSDLSRDCSWECVAHLGLEGEKMISLDPVWCAMSFKKKVQSAHLAEDNIELKYTTSEAKNIAAPPELKRLFSKHTAAKNFFDTLSFINKKEYVVWITGAKKEETKIARLEATIEKLNNGRHNPSDK